jgi:peptide/nickel transport system permease protein
MTADIKKNKILSQTISSQTYGQLTRRRFFRHKAAVISCFVLFVLCAFSFSAPILENLLNTDANIANLFNRLKPPSSQHFFGTDELGRDVFLRLLYGGQISLSVGLIAALISTLIGTIIGMIAGFYRGWTDSVLMRLTDGVIALPLLPLLIILAAIDLTKLGLPSSFISSDHISLYRIIFIIALFGWTGVARLVRAGTLNVLELGYVQAARAFGVKPWRIMIIHILPNISGPIIIAMTLSIGNIILLESVLSFLGLGIQPPMASWGNMLTNAQDLIWEYPHLTLYPGIMIFMTVICFNFIGDGLQDALNPKAIQ